MEFLSNDLEEYITEEKVKIPFERSFASYEGKTEKGKLKKDCWIIEKNNGLTPKDVTKGTSKKYWFQCDNCPHLFKTYLSNITQQQNPTWCPYCANCSQYICKEEDCKHCYQKTFVSYAGKTSKGKLKKDCWSDEKNNGLFPRDVLKFTNKKYWFQCDTCPHLFTTTPNHIINGGWCPYCSIPIKKMCDGGDCNHCYKTSFASYEGKTDKGKLKIDCWISEKNNNLNPRDILGSDMKKYWFNCDSCNHQFQQKIRSITRKDIWCPYCSVTWNKRCSEIDCNFCFKKSFASYEGKTEKGKLKKDCWIVEKNGGLTPRDAYPGQRDKYWFQCDTCPHIFNTTLEGIKEGSWCPYCSIPTKKMCDDIKCEHCIQRSFAGYEGKTEKGKLKKDCWSEEKNNGLTPRDIMKSSIKNKIWFHCDVCNHDFKSNLVNITSGGNWCPYCANQKMCDDLTCVFCIHKSFEGFEGQTKKDKLKKDCWIVEQNNGLTPREVFLTTNKKFTFQCDCCPHIFTSTLNSITREEGVWCPYCSTQGMCTSADCEHCFKKSFASYEGKTPSGNLKINYWMKDKNKGLTPRDTTLSNSKKFWFQCDNCPHSFQSNPGHMTRTGARWCPYCSKPCKKICDKECEHCYKKSFAGYGEKTIKGKLKKDCWIQEKNNGINPRDIIRGCNKKYWFQCDECNSDFNSCIGQITSSNQWCPHCVNKTEQMFQSWFKDNYEYKLESQKRFKWCKNTETNRVLPFDFCIPDLKVIIEIDGDQHFRQVWNWKAPELQQERDVYKMNLALEKGYTIIRIYQPDIYSNKNNWDKGTEEAIKLYDEPQIICIGRKQLKS